MALLKCAARCCNLTPALGRRWAKAADGGWSWWADPPALDAYLRHTPAALLLRRHLLGPTALRALSPAVVALECALPLALLAAPLPTSSLARSRLARAAAGAAAALHLGIGLGMNGALLLSAAAATAWTPLLPEGGGGGYDGGGEGPEWPGDLSAPPHKEEGASSEPATHNFTKLSPSSPSPRPPPSSSSLVGSAALALFGAACVHFELVSKSCALPRRDTFRTVVHNRWNVFAGTESEVC